MKDETKKYFIIGACLSCGALVLCIIGAILVFVVDTEYIGWIGLALVLCAIILLFVAAHFFKKYTNIKTEIALEKSRKEFEEDLEKLQKKWDEAEHLEDEENDKK